MKTLIALVLLLFSCSSLANQDEVSRLLLSEIMFYRMQDDNFDAITSYLNSTEKQELTLNANNHAYIASIYLNYDLHSQVKTMLDLLIKNDSPLIRNTSWFYLGKLHYRNKRIKSAVDTFSKIEGQLSPADQEIKHIMYGVMAINDARYDTAIDELNKVSKNSPYSAYVQYNVAIATMKKNDDAAQLTATLTALAEQQAKTDIAYVFADQIYTTLGFVLLQGKQYEQSLQYFRKVTLDGHLATRALQGMIFAMAEMQQYQKALNLSLQLIKMTIGNEAIHHAYIVIPYLLQKLDNTEKATAFYQHAVEYFSQQRVDLRKYIRKTQRGEFDSYLLDINQILKVDDWIKDPEMGRLFRFVSTLDEWRDAVYKYNEMKYLKKRLDDSFYELIAIEADVQPENKSRYKKVLDEIATGKKKVDVSISWHQKYARRFVINALQNQLDDVSDYLGQARFALAQFYDREEQKVKQLALDALKQQQQNAVDSKEPSVDNVQGNSSQTGDNKAEPVDKDTNVVKPSVSDGSSAKGVQK